MIYVQGNHLASIWFDVPWAGSLKALTNDKIRGKGSLVFPRKLTAGGTQNDGPWKRWLPLNMVMFGIYSGGIQPTRDDSGCFLGKSPSHRRGESHCLEFWNASRECCRDGFSLVNEIFIYYIYIHILFIYIYVCVCVICYCNVLHHLILYYVEISLRYIYGLPGNPGYL